MMMMMMMMWSLLFFGLSVGRKDPRRHLLQFFTHLNMFSSMGIKFFLCLGFLLCAPLTQGFFLPTSMRKQYVFLPFSFFFYFHI